jgi:CheY-like chemotaxis protein
MNPSPETVLFLDDDLSRHEHFKTVARKRGWAVTHVWDFPGVIRALRENPKFDLVFLDHDLMDFHTAPGYNESIAWGANGSEVATWIRDCLPQDKFPKAFVIHSHNPDGASFMAKTIRQSDWWDISDTQIILDEFDTAPLWPLDLNPRLG